ncbi:MAG: response regulator transcription factor [Desulfobacteraceae bacterium]|nr:response regulator transcription factor [Desulfobacteraceae bacterium]
MKRCRIILADDHTLIRRGLRKMLEEDESLQVIGEAGDGLELLDLLRRTEPDLILLDISMPNLRGIEAIGEVRRVRPGIKILILTMHKSEQYLCSAMQAGASGYLLKEDSDTELLPAIVRVMAGGLYISPVLAADFPEDVLLSCREQGQAQADPLTPRERQILKLIAEGITNREIADLLAISKRTVEHHRANLMKKLDAKNTADVVKFAIREGYVPPPAA